MGRVIKLPQVVLDPKSPLAIGLMKMLNHKRLRGQFWRGEITFDQLNQILKEKGINKQYEHPHDVSII
jgi:hypothetical protein